MHKASSDSPVHRRFAPAALMFGNLVTGSSILAPAAMLIELSSDLGITVHTAGLLVTFGAIVLCIGSPLTALLDRRTARRPLAAGPARRDDARQCSFSFRAWLYDASDPSACDACDRCTLHAAGRGHRRA